MTTISKYLVTVLFLAAMLMAACVQTELAPGTRATIGADGPRIDNASPNTLQFDAGSADVGERISSGGVGPASYTVTTDGESRSWRVSQASTEVSLLLNPDGRVSLNSSSGKDVTAKAESVNFDPATRKIAMKNVQFGTDASTPIRAQNEAYDRLVTYWTALSADQRAAVLAQLETQGEIGKTLGDLLGQALRTAAGAP